MKIRLKKGKQKELIFLAKNNLTWKSLAEKIDISQEYLCNDLKNERILISDKNYKELCSLAKTNFDKYILEMLNDNWGKSKGGKLSTGNIKNISIPARNKEFAEFYGIMLGDGNLTKLQGYKLGTYMIRIAGDSRYDYEYLTGFVKSLIEKLFKIKAKIGKFSGQNAIFVQAHSKKIADFLEGEGFKSRNKIKNKLSIPSWIKENYLFLKYCLRGLIDTDGSIFIMSNKDLNLLRISFTNYNKKLLNDVKTGFEKLGFKPSKIISNKQIFLSSKSDIEKYLKEIGFSNLKHLRRLNNFKTAPLCSGQFVQG